jgi:hypothetical protein
LCQAGELLLVDYGDVSAGEAKGDGWPSHQMASLWVLGGEVPLVHMTLSLMIEVRGDQKCVTLT